MRLIAAGATLALCGSLLVLAQEFEVASIKPADPNSHMVRLMGTPGQSNFNGVTLRMLVQQAYDVRDFQVLGGPSWMGSDRYDIVAKVPAGEPAMPADLRQMNDEQRQSFQKRRQAMLQALLTDRFQLKIHKESRELPVYVLTVAKGGPKLKAGAGEGNGKPGMMRMGRGQLTGSQVQFSFLVQNLSQVLGRTVVDQTGLKGTYDFELNWTPDQASSGGAFGPAPPLPQGIDAPPPPDPNGPTIFSAVQEQLGLKLDSGKGPVDVIVVDHAEKPSEN